MRSVDASAHATLEWIKSVPRIAIPVYQRDYRWSEASCEQLLDDIRTARSHDAVHFIGSILAVQEADGSVALVDGQQRVTTLFLIAEAAAQLALLEGIELSEVDALIRSDGSRDRLRLVPHERHESSFQRLFARSDIEMGESTFERNLAFLRERMAGDWRSVWEGMRSLENVTIVLNPANAQQVFEV